MELKITPDEFQISSPGRVVRSVLGHWTFQPNALPPDFTPDWPTIQRMNEAERALGALAGMAGLLPNPQLLLRSFVNREAVASSRIEGTVTTLDQLLLFEVTPDELTIPGDAEEVLNYVRAADFGFAQIKAGYPLSWPLVEELHRILLTGVRGDEKRPGLLRDRPVMIGRTGQTFETARFVPLCHTALRPPLDDLVDFLRTSTLPVIAQLAIAHYQFESIHPFNDGNGRVGRLLIALMLAARGYWSNRSSTSRRISNGIAKSTTITCSRSVAVGAGMNGSSFSPSGSPTKRGILRCAPGG